MVNKERWASPKGNETVGEQLEVPFTLLCQLDSRHLGNSRMNLRVSVSFGISFCPKWYSEKDCCSGFPSILGRRRKVYMRSVITCTQRVSIISNLYVTHWLQGLVSKRTPVFLKGKAGWCRCYTTLPSNYLSRLQLECVKWMDYNGLSFHCCQVMMHTLLHFITGTGNYVHPISVRNVMHMSSVPVFP